MFCKKRILTLILLLLAVFAVLTACGDGDNGDKGGDKDPTENDCKHESYGEWSETKAPTCKETGLRTRKCNGCDNTESEPIEKVGHSFVTYVPNGDATCKDGTKTATCAYGCGATDKVADVGSGTGNHTGGEATCKEAAKCSVCDSPYGYKGSHKFEIYNSNNDATCSADGTKSAYCKYGCGTPDTVTDEGSAGHIGGTATCTVKAKCTRCGNPYGDLTGHKYLTYVYDNNATCGDGTETAKCVNSGCKQTHTRTKVGSGSGQHTGGTATCEFLKVCERCNQPYGLPLQHSFENFISNNDATCKDGTKTATCENPGCEKTKTVTDKGSAGNNHAYELVSSTPVSCTKPASKTEKCSICDKEQTVILAPATGHSLTSFEQKSKTPVSGKDCTYTVVLVGLCEYCTATDAEVTKEEVIHNEKATVLSPATCVSEGTMTYKCQSCSAAAYTKPYSTPDAHNWVKDGDAVSDVQVYKCSNIPCNAEKTVIESTSGTHSTTGSKLAVNELKIGEVSLKLDNATANQLGSETVTVSAKELSGTDRENALKGLTIAQKHALSGKALYDFTMVQNGEQISNFDGKIKITVPYQLGADEDPNCVVVWFINDDGGIEQISASYVKGFATFVTDHFSKYSVTSIDAKESCLVNGHDYKEGANSVAPTCDTVGYTVLVCTRCGSGATAQTADALGHTYGETPAVKEPTCFETGSYVYTCKVSGCGYSQTVVRPATHNFTVLESKSANCQNEGILKEKCTECGYISTTIYPIEPDSHDIKRDAALAEGAMDCSEGVNVFSSCKVKGCTYYSKQFTYNTHDPLYYYKEDAQAETETVEIDISEYFPEAAQYNFALKVLIIAKKAGCACGNGYSEISFSDNGVFGMNELTIYNRDYEGSIDTTPRYYETYGSSERIMLKNVEIADGCIKIYALEVHAGYNASNGTSAKVYTFLMRSEVKHTVIETAVLKYPNTTCKQGVIVTGACGNCGENVYVTERTPYGGAEHCYVGRMPDYSFDKELSTSGHKAWIEHWFCPCGSGELKVKSEGCSFVSVDTANGDGYTETTYSCTCGYRYKTRITEKTLSDCKKVKATVIYFDYDTENETYARSTGAIPINEYIYTHFTKAVASYENQRGCKVEYVIRYMCDCGEFEDVSRRYETTTYKHSTVENSITDLNGRVITVRFCRNCDYYSRSVAKSGYMLTSEAITPDPDTGETVKSIYSSELVDGNLRTVYMMNERVDADGKTVYRTEKSYIYIKVSDSITHCMLYTVDSFGNSTLEELN